LQHFVEFVFSKVFSRVFFKSIKWRRFQTGNRKIIDLHSSAFLKRGRILRSVHYYLFIYSLARVPHKCTSTSHKIKTLIILKIRSFILKIENFGINSNLLFKICCGMIFNFFPSVNRYILMDILANLPVLPVYRLPVLQSLHHTH
jgi:hypothetical protein